MVSAHKDLEGPDRCALCARARGGRAQANLVPVGVRGRAGDLEEPEDSHEAEHAQKVELRGAPGARHSLRHLDAARERVADAWVPAAGSLHPRALAPWRCLS